MTPPAATEQRRTSKKRTIGMGCYYCNTIVAPSIVLSAYFRRAIRVRVHLCYYNSVCVRGHP